MKIEGFAAIDRRWAGLFYRFENVAPDRQRFFDLDTLTSHMLDAHEIATARAIPLDRHASLRLAAGIDKQRDRLAKQKVVFASVVSQQLGDALRAIAAGKAPEIPA